MSRDPNGERLAQWPAATVVGIRARRAAHHDNWSGRMPLLDG